MMDSILSLHPGALQKIKQGTNTCSTRELVFSWTPTPPGVDRCRVVLLGETEISKSTLFSTIISAYQNEGAVQYWRDFPSTSSACASTGKPIKPNFTTLNRKIQLVNVCGWLPNSEADMSLYKKLKSAVLTPMGVVILSIPATETRLSPYKLLLETMMRDDVPHVVAIARTSSSHFQRYGHILQALNLDTTKVVLFEPYCKNNEYFNEKTNYAALELLLHTLQVADVHYTHPLKFPTYSHNVPANMHFALAHSQNPHLRCPSSQLIFGLIICMVVHNWREKLENKNL